MLNSKPNFDTECLSGLELEMMCIALHGVYLHFSDRKALISTSADCIFDNEVGVRGLDPIMAVQDVLGCSVSKADLERDGSLTISFSNGKQLSIRNLHLNTESYTIDFSGRLFVV